MITIDDYILIQRNNGELCKMPIGNLSAVCVINHPDYSKIAELEEVIEETKQYLRELSVEFIQNHYSIDELNQTAEQVTTTENMPRISSLISLNKIESIINSKNLVSKDLLENSYENEVDAAETNFDKLAEQVSKWI